MKTYSTIKLIEIGGETRSFHDYRHAESLEQAELFCNQDFNERVVGEVVKEVLFNEDEKEGGH